METPINDFLKKYSLEGKARFHMPGHKGKAVTGAEELDITEVDGADVLYSADGVIKQSMQNASKLFGTAKTLYSTEGSSLCIRAMVYLLKLYALTQGKKAEIVAFRNAHKTFITACALTGTEITWLYGKERRGITSCNISVGEVREYLEKRDSLPAALYVTSPDYLGNMADIESLSRLCEEKGIVLLVDNAHGAYLNFLSDNKHPIRLGAVMCCDSAHKTLPVLTGGAYLHISQNAPSIFKEKAEYALSLFASTSPSYLIMRSLDMANKILSDGYFEKLGNFCESVQKLKNKLIENGYCFVGDEPLKLTFDCKKYGYTGKEMSAFLSDKNIACEFYDEDYLVLMLTPSNTKDELLYLERILLLLEKKQAITGKPPLITAPEIALALSDCIYMPTEKVRVENSVGRICASLNVSCPPAVPVVVAGERILEREKELLEYYGVEEIEVISE